MRQGQHNKNRSRGRGGGNRGGGGRQSNPLNRVYDSNGPDVKVRGNAQTVADKYLQLARDAVSAGDNVNAENYFQHAEHYLRIVAAAQAFNQQQQQQKEQRRAAAEAENAEAAASEDGDKANAEGEQPSAEKSEEGGRGRRQRGGQRRQSKAADQEQKDAGEDEAGDWQSQAPDFLRRETKANGAADKGAEGEAADSDDTKASEEVAEAPAKPVKDEAQADTAEDVSAA